MKKGVARPILREKGLNRLSLELKPNTFGGKQSWLAIVMTNSNRFTDSR